MTIAARLAFLPLVAAALLAAIVLVPVPARPQGTAADIERYFRVEVSPQAVPRGGWAIEGYVYSSHSYRVNSVRLRVEVLDEAGQVVYRVLGWVPGDVPAGGRAYFFVSIPGRGAAYRVQVLSFYLVAREAQ